MRTRSLVIAVGTLALAFGVLTARDRLPSRAPADDAADRPADREAVVKSSQDFVQAFNKGDAKAIAALWTENGEYQDDNGELIRGRAAIEAAYAQLFKDRPKGTIQVHVGSIRFASPNSAIEDGVLQQSGHGGELPTSSEYSALHVREDGKWRIAFSREGGAAIDRIEDLKWLLGTWAAKTGDQEMTLIFARAKDSPFVLGEYSTKSKGKVVSAGTMKIGFDRQRGLLHSWHFESDGGHGESLWLRDGHRWVRDSVGVTGDGIETASVNILLRNNDREIVMQSIDRVAGDQALPDTTPIRFTRVAEK